MARVLVSFDWHNDRHYRHLLQAWHRNPKFDFEFDDLTPDEIDSSDVGRIKAVITQKVNAATHTLVLVGRHGNDRHRNAALIGYRNWLNFEVARSVENRNRIVAVMLDRLSVKPEELLRTNHTPVSGFSESAIIAALEVAAPAR